MSTSKCGQVEPSARSHREPLPPAATAAELERHFGSAQEAQPGPSASLFIHQQRVCPHLPFPGQRLAASHGMHLCISKLTATRAA